ncbi:MAG: M55 family metallopeptidase [Candidatus Dormibacteraeota bacterium]|nr:M55 family metallopeptidase [Candidatus Dormibacteraeota bacterium]
MKIFISVDMEGVAGVVHPRQGERGSSEYPEAARLMTLECNAAIEGALEAGAQEFIVNDSHMDGRNIVADRLHPAAELISGGPFQLGMCTGIGPGFDAAFFIGYHASVGTADAVIDHTYDPRVLAEVRVNGRAQSEGSLNGAVAGYFDCPLALFTGDAAAVSQMHEFVLPVEGIVVKEGITRFAARSLHPQVARERIKIGARRALERVNSIEPLVVTGDVDIELDFLHPVMADACERIPSVERRGPRRVGYGGSDYLQAFKLFLALSELAAGALPREDR